MTQEFRAAVATGSAADVTGTQQDRVAGMQRLGLAVLPQPVEAAFDIVEAEMAVTVRVDQVGGEGQIVRARLPGLFLLAQRVFRSVITTHRVSAPVQAPQSFPQPGAADCSFRH